MSQLPLMPRPLSRLVLGDCLEVMRAMPDASKDSAVIDPPYGLSTPPDMVEVLTHWLAGDDYQHRGGGFMGKEWDSFVPGPAVWREVYRVLKPGAYLAVFGGTRTYDLLGLALRLAGFEIRDSLHWMYGSGFPKSLNVGKAIDKAAGAEREVVGPGRFAARKPNGTWTGNVLGAEPQHQLGPTDTAPATDAAKQWEGWGTALKPGHEPIILARKPIGPVSCTTLYARTGWDWWYTTSQQQANTPALRLKLRKAGVRVPPPCVEGVLWTHGRKALHAGVTSHTMIEMAPVRQDRQRIEAPRELGRTGERRFRAWSTDTVAANVLAHGTGALNIEACKVGFASEADKAASRPWGRNTSKPSADGAGGGVAAANDSTERVTFTPSDNSAGRWPPNVLLTHSAACEAVGTQRVKGSTGGKTSGTNALGQDAGWNPHQNTETEIKRPGNGDGTETITAYACAPDCPVAALDGQTGAASRFYPQLNWHPELDDITPFLYCAKAARKEREAGCEALRTEDKRGNNHPTVKPVALMEWLCRLVTPPGGVVLDPFMGSGTTGIAAHRCGFGFVGIEKDEDNMAIAQARSKHWSET